MSKGKKYQLVMYKKMLQNIRTKTVEESEEEHSTVLVQLQEPKEKNMHIIVKYAYI